MKQERVVLLGASDQPERYAYKALKLLQQHRHQVIPVHPTLPRIEDAEVVHDLRGIEGPVDTLTLYVNPTISSAEAAAILALRPGRVIFNPGTENPHLQGQLTAASIPWEEACTLVLLHTGQY
jgi:uncharacterized protein